MSEPVLNSVASASELVVRFGNQVVLDREARTLAWPNGADFDPATLDEWPRCKAAFVEMASQWEVATLTADRQ